ncbi:MAG: glycosyltransferase family 4 protein [Terracidiphilus sp.]|jgi:glycosyltransferase involved in cell wall biosynthesis
MRVTLVISQMTMGGAERQFSLLANAWAARGAEVTLFALEAEHPSFFELHPAVDFRCLGIVASDAMGARKALAIVKRPFSLRRALIDSRPEIIVSFINRVNTTTIFASLGLGVPVIAMEATDPFVWKDTLPWRFLRACAYPLAAAVVAQTESAAKALAGKMLGVRAVAISNPVPAADSNGGERKGTRLVSYARFSPEKRLDRLIAAFHLICLKHPQWSLTIAGDGPMLPQLKKQIADLELGDRVSLPGVLRNPRDLLKDADIFVLTSEFEGFPNTLAEAMAHGVPVISFNCKSGPAEIVRDGIDGLLIPPVDVPALARAMENLMNDEPMRLAMGKKAVEVSERFGVEKVLSLWDDLFVKVGAQVRYDPENASSPLGGIARGSTNRTG